MEFVIRPDEKIISPGSKLEAACRQCGTRFNYIQRQILPWDSRTWAPLC